MNQEKESQNETSAKPEGGGVRFRKILVGVDTSDQTPYVLKIASYLSGVLDSKVLVCNVANVVTSVRANERDGFPANDEERRIIDELSVKIHEAFGNAYETRVETKMLHGDPSERISEYAEYSGCDLIIVGSRSHGLFKKTLLGSVSSSIASRSKKPVLIVKE